MTKSEREEQYKRFRTREVAALLRPEAEARGIKTWELAFGMSEVIFNMEGTTEEALRYFHVALYEIRREAGLEDEVFDTVH